MKAKPLRLLAAVITLLFVALVSSSAQAADMKRLLRFAPADSKAIVGADIDKLRTWKHFGPLVDGALRESGGQAGLQQIEQALGIDVRKDVHGLVVALGANFDQDDDQFVIVVQAPLDEQKTVDVIKKEGGQITRKQGFGGHFYDIDGDAGLAFRGDIIILGGKDTFNKAMASRGGALPRLRSRVDGGDLFIAARVPTKVQQNLAGEVPQFADLKTIVASISLNGGQRLVLDGSLGFSNTVAPRTLASELTKQLKELSRERFIRDLGVAKFLSRPEIAASGRNLNVKMTLRASELDQLFKALRP